MITTKNRIGYIQRRYDENNVPHFKLDFSKITQSAPIKLAEIKDHLAN